MNHFVVKSLFLYWCGTTLSLVRLHVVRMLALMGQGQPQVVHRQSRVDAENAQRFATGIEELVPLEHRYRQHIERVEIIFFVFDDDFALAADDQVDFVVKMAMRARAFARRYFRHDDTQRFTMKANARVDNISKVTHRGWLEDQILLLHQDFAFAPELFFVHSEGDLLRVHLSRPIAGHVAVFHLSAAAGDQRLPRVLAFLRIDPKLWIALILINRLA